MAIRITCSMISYELVFLSLLEQLVFFFVGSLWNANVWICNIITALTFGPLADAFNRF